MNIFIAKWPILAAICILPVCGCSSLNVLEPDRPDVHIVTLSETGNCRPLGPVAVSAPYTEGVDLEGAVLREARNSAAALGANALFIRSQSVTSREAASVSLTYAVQGQAFDCP